MATTYISRPYQTECVAAALEELQRGKSTVCVLATGTGKGSIAADVVAQWPGKRCLFIAHRRRLLTQFRDRMRKLTGEMPPLECGDDRVQDFELTWARCVVASKDSLHPKRLARYKPDDFDLIITDEAHRGSDRNKTYKRVYEYFGDAKHLGFTATIDRGDKSKMIGEGRPFETCCYEYPIWHWDKPNAIDDGYLVPIEQHYIAVPELDFSKLKTVAGDFTDKEIEQLIAEEDETLHKIAKGIIEKSEGLPGIAFVATKALAIGVHGTEVHKPGLADLLNRYSQNPSYAVAIIGETKEELREHYFREFAEGRIQWIVNVDVATEGTDIPRAAVCAICRPTKSRNRYAQCAGRVLRPDDEIAHLLSETTDASVRKSVIAMSKKPKAMILDLVGLGDLQLSLSVADIMADDDDERGNAVMAEAKKRFREKPGIDMRQAIDEARAAIFERSANRMLEERWKIVADADVHSYEVDPFSSMGRDAARKVSTPNDLPSWLQDGLTKIGFKKAQYSKWRYKQAREILMKERNKKCSTAQARLLGRHGLDPSKFNFHTAKAALDSLMAHGGRVGT